MPAKKRGDAVKKAKRKVIKLLKSKSSAKRAKSDNGRKPRRRTPKVANDNARKPRRRTPAANDNNRRAPGVSRRKKAGVRRK
jgi:hypothetical protein